MNQEIEIPEKSVFKIEEVATITDVKPYVLRYWASEFNEISPILSSSGQKLYERRHIEIILLIKKLLFDDKLTMAKAKLELLRIMSSQGASFEPAFEQGIPADSVEMIEGEIAIDEEVPELPQDDDSAHLLDDAAWQKLVLAKAKLNSILSFSKTLQERHNWQ